MVILMSNSFQSPEARPSSEASTTKPEEYEGFDSEIPQASEFPVITIVLSFDDPSEPNHVDLGSVPPMVAAAALARISKELSCLHWPSRVTYGGTVVFDPMKHASRFESWEDKEDDDFDDFDDEGDLDLNE